MYQDYIDGKKEIREINMEFRARYESGAEGEEVMNLFETFKNPLEFRDYHLAVFFAQLVIIIASVLLCFKFVFYLDNGLRAQGRSTTAFGP